MTPGRLLAAALVLAGVLAGGGMYYLQVYGYYTTLPPVAELTVQGAAGPVVLTVTDYQGIDSATSPLRLRECFTLAAPPQGLEPATDPTPLNAPGWFDCFDAPALGADLAAGRAQAWRVLHNQPYGFDRVMAVYPDGRAYVWPQPNPCGRAHFDGRPLPAGCPAPPQR